MDHAQVQDRYERYIAQCNAHGFAGLGAFVAPDVNGAREGLQRYVEGLESVVAGFPDYRWKIEQLVVEDDMLAVRLTGAGTHLGPFRGVPATGRVIRTQELVLYRLADGLIAEVWGDLGSTVRDALVSGG